jgi:hypothetical protein
MVLRNDISAISRDAERLLLGKSPATDISETRTGMLKSHARIAARLFGKMVYLTIRRHGHVGRHMLL